MMDLKEKEHLKVEWDHYVDNSDFYISLKAQEGFSLDESVKSFFELRRIADSKNILNSLNTLESFLRQELEDPSKRKDGKIYSIGDNFFQWDADSKKFRKYFLEQDPEWEKLAKILIRKEEDIFRPLEGPLRCKKRVIHTQGRYFCTRGQDCVFRERLTLSDGSYGKDYFCCP